MKKAAVYNVGGDSDEWLKYSIASIYDCFDEIIIVWSDYNWYDKHIPVKDKWFLKSKDKKIRHINFQGMGRAARTKQISKKQRGLDYAYSLGCTHYMLIDSDELWNPDKLPEQLNAATNYLISVAPLDTYYLRSHLRLKQREVYYVPFLCSLPAKLSNTAKYGSYICDPTRKQVNNNAACYLSNIHMQHYSWVRNNLQQKINSHSARKRLVKNVKIQKDIEHINRKGTLTNSLFYNSDIVDDSMNVNSFYHTHYKKIAERAKAIN